MCLPAPYEGAGPGVGVITATGSNLGSPAGIPGSPGARAIWRGASQAKQPLSLLRCDARVSVSADPPSRNRRSEPCQISE